MGVLAQNGYSNTAVREENDFYATDPRAMADLLKHETFHKDIWEPACGDGNLSKVLQLHGHEVYNTDLIQRGIPCETVDFLQTDKNGMGIS